MGFFSSKTAKGKSKDKPAVGPPVRPSSPPPNIYPGYVDSNSARGPNYFDTAASSQQYVHNGHNGHNGHSGHYIPPGTYLNANGGSPGYNDSTSTSTSTIGGNHTHERGYLNLMPAFGVNGDAASIYTASTGDAGPNNALPPPTGIPQQGPGIASYRTGPAVPAVSSRPSLQHQALPIHTRRPVQAASAGLQVVPDQRGPPPPPQQPQQPQQPHQMHQPQKRTVHVKVTAADVRDTTYMLRQLYKMELQIYGARYAKCSDGQQQRAEMRRKADLLRDEIEDTVRTWSMTDAAGWTPEELLHVQYSIDMITSLRTMAQDAEV